MKAFVRGDRPHTRSASRTGKRYVESDLTGDDFEVESTLWHDGRVGITLRREGAAFFAFSFYPAIVNPSEPQDAVYIDLGVPFISSRTEGTTTVTVDDYL